MAVAVVVSISELIDTTMPINRMLWVMNLGQRRPVTPWDYGRKKEISGPAIKLWAHLEGAEGSGFGAQCPLRTPLLMPGLG